MISQAPTSIFDKIDEAHRRYLARHKRDEKLIDDVNPADRDPPRSDMAGIVTGEGRRG